MKKRRVFVLDTSVLLYDMKSIHSFPGSDVVIPLVVLDELDRFKDKRGLLGESARYVNRFLDSLRENGNLHSGINLENDQTVRVELNNTDHVPGDLDPKAGDNKIISVGLTLMKEEKDVTVVTKDINFRVKCDALNLSAEDYYKDHINIDGSQIYSGVAELEATKSDIDEFYQHDKIEKSVFDSELYPNQFVVCKSSGESASMMGIVRGDHVKSIKYDLNEMIHVNPRNKEQKFALSLLVNKKIKLVSMTGIAGSGKTFLTLMSALSGMYSKDYDRIIITRSIQPVGREMGFLPGDIDDKMSPWISPIVDNFRFAFNDISYFEMLCQKGQIEIAPLAYMRGRTFNKAFIIVDEAQNATIHELKTIITRVGEGSKIVLLGDVEQIDTPYIDTLSNGLTIITEKLKDSDITGHVTLRKGERSALATLASKVL